eukprot:CAMPEP_0118972512 /NCGR_PEP_ID=MMETSP1173-20130426/8799_1 /TAXON_ID=1034831 /ORGANISM="Rhizochromulina marina cf, Strain CCMP1243" /LENGTH=112 /DNA_ID=CAMNT_0006922057 /DNA_START=398 /DNA_END=736 /DNA_ORIENTATION=+
MYSAKVPSSWVHLPYRFCPVSKVVSSSSTGPPSSFSGPCDASFPIFPYLGSSSVPSPSMSAGPSAPSSSCASTSSDLSTSRLLPSLWLSSRMWPAVLEGSGCGASNGAAGGR